MSLDVQLRQALPEAMRARDKVAVRAIRSALAALDNAGAVPLDGAPRAGAIEGAPIGAGAAEAPRRELGDDDMVEILRAEAAERLSAADELAAPEHAARVAELRGEAVVLLGFLEGSGPAGAA
ncbi:GatB/YqeY domain-containing protein [Streptomyces sp. NRRL F-5126]|uniref:GatB/YqeY domain-containing protein n=1 Tax=Streptomyces sp. NRRL F-5126 TaxID=1463857 RepID=UPI000AF73896|nr:GatB/YqeY domain-containing protein [Streptomyces sp. NRRL F-5126]